MKASQFNAKKKQTEVGDRSFKLDRSEPLDKFASKQPDPPKELQVSSIRDSVAK